MTAAGRSAPLRSWWAKRWAEAFSAAVPEARVRGRGRQRSAKLLKLDPVTGEAFVEISTSSLSPTEVRIAVASIPTEVWEKATAALAREAKHVARLLSGELPQEMEDAFVAAGGSIFPGSSEVRIKCNCLAGTGGCRHGGLAQRALAEAIDRDPFLLFDLRGRPRAEVLTALGLSPSAGASAATPHAAETPKTAEAPIDPALFRRARGELAGLSFHVAPPEQEHLLLLRLGDPPGWRAPPSFLDAIAPVVELAASRARTIAIGDDETPRT